MESVLQIIVLLAFVRFACRATFFRTFRSICFFSLLVAVLSFVCYPIVIEQSGDFYATLLADDILVGNVAVLITLEALLGMLLSIGLMSTLFRKSKKNHFHMLRYMPELLIVGAVLYAEQQIFYTLPGYDFRLTASITAAVFAGGVGLFAYLLGLALPERSGRYELNFLINAFLLLVAVLLNAGLSRYNVGSYRSEINWLGTATFLSGGLLLCATGFSVHQIKLGRKNKKIEKWI